MTEAERLLHRIGNAVLNMSDKFQDEGDRVYFESTNDADMLRELGREYWDWQLAQEPATVLRPHHSLPQG